MAATTSVFLNVQDIDKSIEWYKAMGFKVDHAWKDEDTGRVNYADLSYQGAELGLGHIPANDDPSFRQWVSTPLGAGVLVYFSVPNVDKMYENARKLKADIEMPVTDRPYGRTFMVTDPNGYSLSFITEKKKPKKAAAKKAKSAKKKAPARKAKKTAKRKAR